MKTDGYKLLVVLILELPISGVLSLKEGWFIIQLLTFQSRGFSNPKSQGNF